MKLEFRQRLLATTLLVGAGLVATPAIAQEYPVPETVDPEGTTNPADTSSVTTIPETTAPVEGTPIPSTSATGEPVRAASDIIVTGSRIPQPNLDSASPVTVVTSQEVKLSGTSRTEDLINSLPQSFAAQGSNIANGASGTANVNLRGLGSGRTLVLINGRRMQPGDPRQPVADINFIPSQLIKRVDVLTGGASSVYGADAVAGVVNFIMDTSFTGFRIDGQASVFNHHNGDVDDRIVRGMTEIADLFGQEFLYPKGWSTNGGAQDIAGVFGASFDDGRGHVQAYATYRSQDAVLQASRAHSFCALGSFAPVYVPDYGEFYCGGSGTSATGTFIVTNPITGDNYTVVGDQFSTNTPLFNYAPYNYFQRPNERYTLGAFANYEISPAAEPYLEVMFMNDQSRAQIAPSGNFANTGTLNCDNPLYSDQQRAILCPVGGTFIDPTGVERTNVIILRRNVEGGGRVDDLEHTSFRIVGGMRGDIARGISYDAYYQFGTTKLAQTYFNDFSVTRLGRALDVVSVDADGNIVAPNTPGSTAVCRAVVTGLDANCVPWNIFVEGGVTPEALAYLQTPGFLRGHVNQTIAQADFTILGDEYGWRMPWAETGVGINVGAAYVKNLLETNVDTAFLTGDLAGQGGPTVPVSGDYDVRELFGEIQIPVVQNNFIDEFIITAGYRFSNYHVGGDSFNTDAYKIAAELAPIPDIRFRASYNRAVRAPNVVELFSPQSIGLAGNVDPCAGPNPIATLAQCANTGVTAAQYGNIPANPANQYNALFGGNPELAPETADTYTAGIVLQPRFIPGFAFTADYFDIKIDDLIGTVGFQSTLNSCLQSGALCDLINRDALGSLWLTGSFVQLTNVNIGGLRTKGVDFNASYARRLGGLGTFNASFVGTWLHDLITDTGVQPGGNLDGIFDCASWYGAFCGTPNPKWRHKLRIGLTMPNGIGVSGQWRYFSKVQNDALSADPDLASASNPGDDELKAMSFFDLAFTARLAQRLNLRVGANNIFDTDPPVASGNTVGPPFGSGNTYPQVYDSLGRYLFAGFTIDF